MDKLISIKLRNAKSEYLSDVKVYKDMQVHLAVARKIQSLIKEPECEISLTWGRVHLSALVSHLREIVPILAELRLYGYKKPSIADVSSGRDYQFEVIKVHAILKSQASCKMVQVGTKTDSYPVFEMHCNGEKQELVE